MTVKDYALESNKDVKTIIQILKDNDINVSSENDELDDEAIVLLDIICGSVTTEEEKEVEVDENLMDKYEFEDRAESMLEESNLNIAQEKKEKIKKKDNSKEKEEYLKNKKNLYKHKQKLEILGSAISFSITSRISNLAFLACANAFFKISLFIPLILISICNEQIPFLVPPTLKSMSPKWSSIPWISVKIVYDFSSLEVIRPIAIPATGALIGTPAAINDIQPAQIDAWLDDPFDSRISDTTRIVYGNSSSSGIT